MSSLRFKLFLPQAHTLEKKGGENWQQLAARLEEAGKCHMGASTMRKLFHHEEHCHEESPVQWEWCAQAGICASFRGVGLLRQFSLASSQPHAVQFCDILSRTEQPYSCQKPDASPVHIVFLLLLFSLQTDSILHVAVHSDLIYQNVPFL